MAVARQAEEHGGDRVVAALRSHGVSRLFTLCGGHISPILTSAKAHAIRVIDVRSEATAVFAADGTARLTGTTGVAAITAGPGVTNCVTALKNAQLAQSPTLVLGGAVPTLLRGRGALQDIDQHAVVAPHVKVFKRVRHVRDLGHATDEALTAARDGVQGPAFVECPVDLLYPRSLVGEWYREAAGKGNSAASRLRRLYVSRHFARLFAGGEAASPLRPSSPSVPAVRPSSVAKAARRLAQASRPLAIVGSQALAAGTDPARVATAITRLEIPVYLSGMARGLLGRDHRLQLHHQRRQALSEADYVMLIGTPCDFRLDYGRQLRGSTTLIAANRSARDARLNRTPDIAAIGDPGLFLQQLAEEAGGTSARWQGWIDTLHERDAAKDASIEREAAIESEFVNPISLLRAIDRCAGDNAIFVADGGDFVATASYILRPRGPRTWLDPGPFGTLGVGAGFGLAAALCRPEAEVWILFGDGACGYSLVEFDTFVRHGVPIIAVVGNDAGWTQIAREQVKILKDDVGTVLSRTAYHEIASGFGGEGILVKTAAEIPGAMARARATAQSGRPVLINAWLSQTAFREGSIAL
ncbi:MAG TPA: thiamine pyrophosphate-binding protein [Steroidobacteraceae bacterium]|nr:thiamine pyrophosphate-binding protein [Steroidobacteraceae bacterium]